MRTARHDSTAIVVTRLLVMVASIRGFVSLTSHGAAQIYGASVSQFKNLIFDMY
jgi:hypothetical protein